jgi:hypothetical protein
MRYLGVMLALWVGIALGLAVPDLDLRVPILTHRSILTHGLLLPCLLCVLAWRGSSPILRLFAIGFSSATAIHLCFDLFPKAWIGFALITVPLVGQTSPLISWLWIATSSVVCLYLAGALMRRPLDALISSGSLAMSMLIYARAETSLWWGLSAVIGATCLAVIWRGSVAKR